MLHVLREKLTAEFVGTGLLTAVVVGSGRMGTGLTDDRAVALLLNAVATVAAPGLLIWTFAPISGAHFNPAVTVIMRLRGGVSTAATWGYVIVQASGAIAGAVLANVLYDQSAMSISRTDRGGLGQLIAEIVATAGLVAIICTSVERGHQRLLPVLVPAWIISAYLFTSSTSFANPAVTLGRVFSDSFAGISPASVAPFVCAQVVGAMLGWVVARSMSNSRKESADV